MPSGVQNRAEILGASGTSFTLGFGVDVRLTQRLDFRFSGGIGDLDGIGLGVAILH